MNIPGNIYYFCDFTINTFQINQKPIQKILRYSIIIHILDMKMVSRLLQCVHSNFAFVAHNEMEIIHIVSAGIEIEI